MSLTTTNGKMAVMEWEGLESGIITVPGVSFGQDDKQQLIWGIPEVLWATAAGGRIMSSLAGHGGLAGGGGLAGPGGGLAG